MSHDILRLIHLTTAQQAVDGVSIETGSEQSMDIDVIFCEQFQVG